MNKYLISLIGFTLVLASLAKDPTPILPKNPNDPLVLPAGVAKKVLVVGK
jgi:hypothetical protein